MLFLFFSCRDEARLNNSKQTNLATKQPDRGFKLLSHTFFIPPPSKGSQERMGKYFWENYILLENDI